MDVADYSEKVSFVVDRFTVISALLQETCSIILHIEPHRITCVNAAEYSCQWGVRGMDDKMNVIGHQAICIDFKLTFFFVIAQDIQVFDIIILFFKHLLSVCSTNYNVVDV